MVAITSRNVSQAEQKTEISYQDLLNDNHHLLRGNPPHKQITTFEAERLALPAKMLVNKVPGVLYVVQLRNPVTWEVSRYNECRIAYRARKPNSSFHYAGVMKNQASKGRLCENWENWDKAAEDGELFLRGILSIKNRSAILDETALLRAKGVLEKYDAVLILEDHEARYSDLNTLRRLAGWPGEMNSTAICGRCRQSKATNGAERHLSLDVDAYLTHNLPGINPAQIARIKERHLFDVALYNHGRALSMSQRVGSFWPRPPGNPKASILSASA